MFIRFFFISIFFILFIWSCQEESIPPNPVANKYTLTIQISPEEGGTVFPSTGKYNEGSQVSVQATANQYFEFDKWGGNGNDSKNNPLNVTVNSNITLIAEFSFIDADGDGVTDDLDECPDTPENSSVNSKGCASFQSDADGDGVTDDLDECPDTPENTAVDSLGCVVLYIDENGMTIKATELAEIGEKYILNDIEYTVIDEITLREKLNTNADIDLSILVTTFVINMNDLFGEYGSTSYNISNWDVSNVIGMSELFRGNEFFNSDISFWDVSSVTDMYYMFSGAYEFNQDISSWDVGNVINMEYMFTGAHFFNQDISSWDVHNVTNMMGMFSGAVEFNQPIGSWDVRNVTIIDGMFSSAYEFNQPIGSWDVSNINSLSYMFEEARKFNQDISSWDVENVTVMYKMFYRAVVFNKDISSWDVSNVTNMYSMFFEAIEFNQDISSWDVENVTSCYYFNDENDLLIPPNFSNCSPCDISNLDGTFDAVTTGYGSWCITTNPSPSRSFEWVRAPSDTDLNLYVVVDFTYGAYFTCYGGWTGTPEGNLKIKYDCGVLSPVGVSQWGEVYTFNDVFTSSDGKTLTIDWSNDYNEAGVSVFTNRNGQWETWPLDLTN